MIDALTQKSMKVRHTGGPFIFVEDSQRPRVEAVLRAAGFTPSIDEGVVMGDRVGTWVFALHPDDDPKAVQAALDAASV